MHFASERIRLSKNQGSRAQHLRSDAAAARAAAVMQAQAIRIAVPFRALRELAAPNAQAKPAYAVGDTTPRCFSACEQQQLHRMESQQDP